MPTIPLTENLRQISGWREANPDLASLNNVQLAQLIERVQPGQMTALANSNVQQRALGHIENMFGGAGQATEQAALNLLGDNPVGKTVGRAGNFMVASVPEMLGGLAGSYALKRFGPLGRPLASMIFGGTGVMSYGRARAGGATQKEAAGQGLSAALAAPLSIGGAALGSKLVGGALGRAGGAAVGGTVADAVEVGMMEDPKQFMQDPYNLIAMGALNLGSFAYDYAAERGEARRNYVETVRRAAADLDKTTAKTAMDDYLRISRIPAAARTEQDEVQLRESAKIMGDFSKSRLLLTALEEAQKKGPLTIKSIPEAHTTLAHQFKLMQQGKKPAVLVPDGSGFVPREQFSPEKWKTAKVQDGTVYYDPTKVDESAIAVAEQSGAMDSLLGYGDYKLTEWKGLFMVLRDNHGHEKAVAPYDFATADEARKVLERWKEPTDYIRDESMKRVLALRAQRQEQIRTHSLGFGDREFAGAGLEVWIAPPGTDFEAARQWYRKNVAAKKGVDLDRAQWTGEPIQDEQGRTVIVDPDGPTREMVKKLGWTQRGEEQMRLFSLADQAWSYTLLDQLSKAVKPVHPGMKPKFTLDQTGGISTRALRLSVEQTTPKEIREVWKAAGIDEVLKG
jgi:hypothetical protein